MLRKLPMSRPTGPFLPRTPDELFYFELETFLDNWRRRGVPNDMIRTALARAERASLAMDGLAKRLQAADHAQT
jgi:hypothetical protein